MKSLLFVLLVVSFVFGQDGANRYDNYQVLRIDITNETECGVAVYQMASDLLADVWAGSCADGWVDVMVSPEQKNSFVKRFSTHVRIPDVQASLDEHYADRNNSKGETIFDHFPTTDEVNEFINDIVTKYPTLAKRISIGTTYSGKTIYGLSLTRGSPNKKVFYIHGTIHAREWITTTSTCYIIEQLVSTTAGLTLLDKYEWIIVPIFNIDGYDYTHASSSNRLWRKSRQPNTGSSCVGTDINRNYPFRWGGNGASTNPCDDTYRGSAAGSTPEVRAETQFLTPLLSRLISYIDIHSYGGYFLSAWGYTSTAPNDYAVMRQQMTVAVNAIRSVNGRTYTSGASGPTLYPTSGSTVDWVYGTSPTAQPVSAAYTIECYGNNFTPGVNQIEPIAKEVLAGVFALANYLK